MNAAPPRGFPEAEYAARTARAQAAMAEAGLDALLLTTEPEVREPLGKPVLASNQVLAWHMLQLAGLSRPELLDGGSLAARA